MRKFLFPVLREGYSFTLGNNLREQTVEGGEPRSVVKFVGAVHTVNVTIALKDEQEQSIFWAFWRKHQGKRWLWELVLDNGNLEECECRFTSESIPTESNRGFEFIRISFQVIVIPIKRDPDFDEWILDRWEKNELDKVNDYEKVPNVYFPAATGV